MSKETCYYKPLKVALILLIFFLLVSCATMRKPIPLPKDDIAFPSTSDLVIGKITKYSETDVVPYSFLYYIPKTASLDIEIPILMAASIGPRTYDLSDTENFSAEYIRQIKGYADKYNFAVLLPCLPDYEGFDAWTRHLSRSILRKRIGTLRIRPDQAVLLILNHFREMLSDSGYQTERRVLLDGYSISAHFANRFALLHPEEVKACAVGGMSGLWTMPLAEYKNVRLTWPIGIADLEHLIGLPFDSEEHRSIHLFAYVGSSDDFTMLSNHRNSNTHTESQKSVVRKLFGTTPMNVEKQVRILEEIGYQVSIRVYHGAGHREARGLAMDDVVSFLISSYKSDP